MVGAKSYTGSSWDSSAMDGQRTRWRRSAVCCAEMVFISIAEVIAEVFYWVVLDAQLFHLIALDSVLM